MMSAEESAKKTSKQQEHIVVVRHTEVKADIPKAGTAGVAMARARAFRMATLEAIMVRLLMTWVPSTQWTHILLLTPP
jgi:hypothetical protein